MTEHEIVQQLLRITLLITAAVFAEPSLVSAQEPKLPPDLKKVAVADGVELHYVEKGKGVPVVFVTGGGGEYWPIEPLGPFAESYRVITYSSRHSYPNTNKPQPNYSMVVAAEDLAGLIKKLDLGKVHVVGHSLGGQKAMLLALKHPELVRSLTLGDAPVHFKGDKAGEVLLPSIKAARAAFEKGNTEEALEAIFEVPAGRKVKFNQFPEPARKSVLRNAGELEALVKGETFPEVDREAVKKLAVPTLLMFGEKSPPVFKTFEEELMRLLPEKNRKLVIIRNADHGFPFTHAEPFRKEVLEFLKDK
jgi:pimeloyl-ACP methyl ester carboxylesterase